MLVTWGEGSRSGVVEMVQMEGALSGVSVSLRLEWSVPRLNYLGVGCRSGLNSTVIVISKLADWQVGVRYLFLFLVSSLSFCVAVWLVLPLCVRGVLNSHHHRGE